MMPKGRDDLRGAMEKAIKALGSAPNKEDRIAARATTMIEKMMLQLRMNPSGVLHPITPEIVAQATRLAMTAAIGIEDMLESRAKSKEEEAANSDVH